MKKSCIDCTQLSFFINTTIKIVGLLEQKTSRYDLFCYDKFHFHFLLFEFVTKYLHSFLYC